MCHFIGPEGYSIDRSRRVNTAGFFSWAGGPAFGSEERIRLYYCAGRT